MSAFSVIFINNLSLIGTIRNNFKIKILGIEKATSWSIARHAGHSSNEAVVVTISFEILTNNIIS